MIERIRSFFRRRARANLEDELVRLRALRLSLTQQEFVLRGKLAVLEATSA